MAASVQIDASFNGKPLDAFAKVLQQRMTYMRETARDSVAACAIQVLRSIRTVTRVAKPSKAKVKLEAVASLYPSFSQHAAQKKPCLRVKGSRQRYSGKEIVRFAGRPANLETWGVWRFNDDTGTKAKAYLIAAPTSIDAKEVATKIVQSRIKRYAGLAKRAISILMQKTFTKSVADNVPLHVTQKAKQVTHHVEKIAKGKDGGKYALILQDDLRYALDAIKGGQSTVDLQMKKAMNKIVATINHKLKNGKGFFGDGKLETPFPEIVRRK